MLGWMVKKRRWKMQGEKDISLGESEATFAVESDSDAHSIRHFLREESAIAEDLLDNIRPDDIFWDVGANMGIYSCLVAPQLPSGEVVAFEPFPPNVRRLRENIALNEVDVSVKDLVLSDQDGQVEFASAEVDPTGSGSVTIAASADTPTHKTDSVRADSLINSGDVPTPSVMKIDVEGAEQMVLEGAQETIHRESCRTIYCEVHQKADHRESLSSFGGSVDEVRSILDGAGYTIQEMDSSPNELFLKCEK